VTRTVRDATVDVLRHHQLTTIFANPGLKLRTLYSVRRTR